MNVSTIMRVPASAPTLTPPQQRRVDFHALAQAVGQGDVSGAQAALAKVQGDPISTQAKADFHALRVSLAKGDLSGAQAAFADLQTQTGNSPLNSTALNALGQALGAGDLSGAQSAFSTLQTNLKQEGQDFQALAQAVGQGDISSAQSALATLQTYIQSANGTTPATSVTTTTTGGSGAFVNVTA